MEELYKPEDTPADENTPTEVTTEAEEVKTNNINAEAEEANTNEVEAEAEEANTNEVNAEAEEADTNEAEAEAEEPKKRDRGTTETMDDYAAELDDSLRRIYAGDIMEATVVSVDETGVTVDLDYYAPGRIPAEEMSADPSFSIMNDVSVGDTFKAVVTKVDDGGGNILLSKKSADSEFAWERLEKMKEDNELITGKITEVVKAGAIMYVEGIRGFIPASKLDLKYVEDTEPYLGQKINVLISEVNQADGKLILSAKELLAEAALARRSENVKKMTVGSIVEGTVDKLMNYGAFIDIGNDLSGLLHVSEISEKRISHPKSVLKEGQKVTVMISKIENGKISLSMKALEEAREKELDEEAVEYKAEYVPNNPFAALLKDVKLP